MLPELEELAMLRQVTDNISFPAWKTDTAGVVYWTNDAYEQLKGEVNLEACEVSGGALLHKSV